LTYLNHLNANEGIECILPFRRDSAVIHEMHTDAAFETSGSDTLFRKALLFNREGQSVDFAAKGFCGLDELGKDQRTRGGGAA
jgi:hypothetical protein